MTEKNPDADFARAKRALLEATARYDEEGERLEARCLKHFRQFVDDPEGRAEELSNAAAEVEALIHSFGLTHASILHCAALAGLNLQASVGFLTMQAVNDSLKSLGTGKTLSKQDYLDVGREMVSMATQAFDLASGAIDLRRATLAEFLGDKVETSAADILASMWAVARANTAEKLLEGLAAQVPGVQPLLTAVKYVNDVREHLDQARPVYRGRGPEDNMFEFRRALVGQGAVLDGIKAAVDAQSDAMVSLRSEFEKRQR